MATVGAIAKAIRETELELPDVDRLSEELMAARKRAAARHARTLRVGDIVVLGPIKPKYLNGETGRITALAGGGKVSVYMDHQVGRYSRDLKIPAQCLTVIQREEN